MNLSEAQEKFINAWGALGSNWGINRTMAQIHALLLISPDPITTDDMMDRLNISRGNANMNVRSLIDWGLAEKVHISGERKEYFKSEKDIWVVARRIARERRKREIEPIHGLLEEIQDVKDKPSDDLKEFKAVTADIYAFTKKSDGMLDKFIRSDEHWFYSTLVKLIK